MRRHRLRRCLSCYCAAPLPIGLAIALWVLRLRHRQLWVLRLYRHQLCCCLSCKLRHRKFVLRLVRHVGLVIVPPVTAGRSIVQTLTALVLPYCDCAAANWSCGCAATDCGSRMRRRRLLANWSCDCATTDCGSCDCAALLPTGLATALPPIAGLRRHRMRRCFSCDCADCGSCDCATADCGSCDCAATNRAATFLAIALHCCQLVLRLRRHRLRVLQLRGLRLRCCVL